MMKKFVVPGVVLAMALLVSITFPEPNIGSGQFSTPAAANAYEQMGNISEKIPNAVVAMNIMGNGGEIGFRSSGCSTGCSTGCSVGCSTGCSVGCSTGCSVGCNN